MAVDTVKLIHDKRNFGFMSMLGFSCTIMVTWEGVLVYVHGHLRLRVFTDKMPSLFIQGFSKYADVPALLLDLELTSEQ